LSELLEDYEDENIADNAGSKIFIKE